MVCIINPLTSPGEGVIVFKFPYLSAGAPALGEAKGLMKISWHNEEYSYSYKEEDYVISEQTNHKKREVLHMIKSKLKIIQYTKKNHKKIFQLNLA